MRQIEQGALDTLDAGRIARRNLVLFELDSNFGFWDDVYDITFDGNTYVGGAGKFTISALPSVNDMSVQGVSITFSGLDTDALVMTETEDYHQRPVSVYLALMDQAGGFLSVKRWFTGVTDQAVRREQAGGDATLTVRAEPISRELGRSGARVRSDADQRLIDADDGFFRHVASAASQKIYWGRKGPQKP